MSDQLAFMGAVFGSVTMLAYWVSRLLMRDDLDERIKNRLQTAAANLAQPLHARRQDRVGDLITRLGAAAARPFEPKTREKQSSLRRKLGYAGIYSAGALRVLAGFRVISLAAGIIGGYLLGAANGYAVLTCALGGLAGYCLPAAWLRMRIRKHQAALEEALPDAIDLLVVCVEAGLTIDAAMQRVGMEIALAHPPLARELEITHLEMRVGLSRADALRNMGTRTGCEPIQGLAAMLVQADRFGTSIAQALRIHAESLRTARQYRAEEKAAKASVKLSFPLVLFIFPAVLIVLAGPALLGLFKSALFN